MAQHAKTKKPTSREPAAQREEPTHPSRLDVSYRENPIGEQAVVSPSPENPTTVRVPPQDGR